MSDRAKLTEILVNDFEERGIIYKFSHMDKEDLLATYFSVQDNGPDVLIGVFVTDSDPVVSIKAMNICENAPQNKRGRLLEAINIINQSMTFSNLFINDNNSVLFVYNIPINTSDECLPAVVFEILCKARLIIDVKYYLIKRALETNEPLLDPNDEERENTFKDTALVNLFADYNISL